jgi:hypothetical protein
LVLVAAACGGASAGDESAPLPVNNNPDATPVVTGMCAQGEPDCVDTIVVGGNEPQDLPNDDTGPDVGSVTGSVISGGMPVDGGLSVPEALTTEATGVIAVQGFLFDDGTGARLCEALAESYPPQCGAASIPVTGYEDAITIPLSNAQGVNWSDQPVTLFGEVLDGTLVVSSNTSG